MRLPSALLLASSMLLGACTVRSADTSVSDPDNGGTSDVVVDPTPAPPPPPAHEPAAPTTAAPGVLPEVVYLFMTDKENQGWMCTATLIAADRVVTAAHCLDTNEFTSWWIVAPSARSSLPIVARDPRVFGGPYSDVANPDLGVLTLASRVELPTYARLTDVTARVEAGEDVRAAAVVRTAEEAEAPLHEVDGLAVSSTVQYGYMHGFGTPMFSEGGDSGAGLFLVEDGKITHELIGVARQPEPSRNLDHFTRIDSDMLAWYASQ